jgi:polar amino acid transport system substrate-binding protein
MGAGANSRKRKMADRSLLDEVRERGALRIPVQFSSPPEEGPPPEFYLDPEAGEPQGIAPIIGRLMAKDLGAELECVDMPWPEHIPALLSGKVDLLPKHVNTAERALAVEFANGRLMAYRVTALIPADSTVTDKEELNREGKVISVWHGSSIREVIKREFPLATMKESRHSSLEVEEGKADACLTDSVTKIFLEKHPGLKFLRDREEKLVIFSREYAQIAIKPGDQRFLNWINNWYQYHEAQGTIGYWCDTWWESFMADRE